VESFVRELYREKQAEQLPYHNLFHTKKVVAYCSEIAAYYELNSEQWFALHVAAWFHDTGHLTGGFKNHEERSVDTMMNFFEQQDWNINNLTLDIAACIMATRYPPTPTSFLGEILCDADTYHFGTGAFCQTDPLVKCEVENAIGKKIEDWYHTTITLLERHTFFTGYCQEKLTEGKKTNIEYLKAKALSSNNADLKETHAAS